MFSKERIKDIDVSRLITRCLSLDEIGEGLEYTGRREGLKVTIKF